MNRFLVILTILTILITSCNLQETYTKGEMTLLFYFGEDYRYDPLNLWADIVELTKHSVDITNKRVTILFDGETDGDSKLLVLDSQFGRNYREVNLSDTNINQFKSNELNMGSEDTLTSYIKYVKQMIPSDQYCLYLSGHGAGYRSYSESCLGLETNINNKIDFLTVKEISNALKKTGGVELLVFDSCLMGNIETIYELEESTRYIIASPEDMPGPGNNYTPLIENYYSHKNINAFDLGIATLNSYYNYYKYDNPDHAAQSPETYNLKNYNLLQMYDTKKICEVINSESFESTIISYTLMDHTNSMRFDRGDFDSYGHYLRLNLSEINEHIYTSPEDYYKLISIYYPTLNVGFNEEYKKSRFGEKFPSWSKNVENRMN